MAKLSDVLKAAELAPPLTSKVIRILKESYEYGNKVSYGLTGTTIDGDVNEIARFVKAKIKEENNKTVDISDIKAEYFEELDKTAVYKLLGARGRKMWVLDDRCVIRTEVTAGSVITGNISDGEKTIFYHDCIGVQLKEAGSLLGYLQLETASGIMNNNQSNFFNENTFTFDNAGLNKHVREVSQYIIDKVALYKKLPFSSADEIKKYKELLDSNAITQEEYDIKKAELLAK